MSAQIPSSQPDAIRILLALPPERLQLLARAFAEASIQTSVKKFIDRVVGGTARDSEDIRRVVPFFISLEMALLTRGGTAEDFTKDFIEHLRSSQPERQQDEAYWGQLAQQVCIILSSEALRLIAKSLELQRDNEKLFSEARILTDIRPVFGDDVHQPPPTGVVLHTLKLSFYSGEDKGDFYIVLDRVDLRRLREAIDRALDKDVTLKAMMDSSKWSALQAEEEGSP